MPKVDRLTTLRNQLLKELRAQEESLRAGLARIQHEIATFTKDGPFPFASTGKRRGRPAGSKNVATKKRRKMSAAGRARIAAAQKARWAKIKAGKKGSKKATTQPAVSA
jgi:hypothetical protein